MRYVLKNNSSSQYHYKDRYVNVLVKPYTDLTMDIPEASLEKFEQDINQDKYSAVLAYREKDFKNKPVASDEVGVKVAEPEPEPEPEKVEPEPEKSDEKASSSESVTLKTRKGKKAK